MREPPNRWSREHGRRGKQAGVRLGVSMLIKSYSATTYRLLDGGVQILLDALTVEDVPTLGLNGIFGDIIANSTDSRLAHVLWQKRTSVRLAS